MLRALGASRRQVLGSVIGEAGSLGIIASLLGLFAGLGVAKGINALFKAFGADIPHAASRCSAAHRHPGSGRGHRRHARSRPS